MRCRGDYSLYKRTLRSGKSVVYYMTYDKNGNRTTGRSTGKRTLSEAKVFCNALIRADRLIPEHRRVPLFKDFSAGWWEWDSCQYLKRRMARRPISRSYADTAKHVLDYHLLPYFKDMRLDLITDVDVENWLTTRKDFGLSNKSANLYLSILSVMLNEAVRLRLIKANPTALISKLKEAEYAVEILTQNEVLAIFQDDWKLIWSNAEGYLANKMAACTGLRIGEVVGLRGIDFFGTYISVRGQYCRYGFTDTKTHKSRNIPIPSGLAFEIAALKKRNGAGYLFSANGGETPVSKDMLGYQLKTALERIGIMQEEQKRRHLTFHSWRHFFNTTLRSANVADSKVRAITGHQTKAMTDHYTHYDTREFLEVRKVQEALLIAGPAKRVGRTAQEAKPSPRKRASASAVAKAETKAGTGTKGR